MSELNMNSETTLCFIVREVRKRTVLYGITLRKGRKKDPSYKGSMSRNNGSCRTREVGGKVVPQEKPFFWSKRSPIRQ